jgi:branched-chain amino acid transport system ATP-binding protein
VRRGLILVPEGRAIFANLSVRENLEMGAYARRDREVEGDFEKVFRIFPRLKERIKQTAGRSPAASSRCSRSAAR